MSQNVDKPTNLQKFPCKYFRVKAGYAPLVLAAKGEKRGPVWARKRKERQYKAPSNWTGMTPYEVIRKNNCKSFQFFSEESYPSIRPTQFICSEKQTAEEVLDAVVQDCGRYFRMEKDDIVDMWKQSPDKNTLGFYGIDTESQQEDADAFNRLVSKCLKKVAKKEETQPKIKTVPKKPKKEPEGDCEGLVLNHMLLHRKVYTMPTVKKKISAINALETMHCPPCKRENQPFVKTNCDGFFNLKSLHGDMGKCGSKKKNRRRRKHKFCDLNTVIPENECTYLEWLKYKNDPKPFAKAFNEEMEEMQKLQMQPTEPEPKNYEELYEKLMECFENNQLDPLCEAYKACCLIKRKGDDEGGAPIPKVGIIKVPKRVPLIEQKKKPEDETEKSEDETKRDDETVKGDDGKDKPKKSKMRRKESGTLWEQVPQNKPIKDKEKTKKIRSDTDSNSSLWEELPPNKPIKDNEKTRKSKKVIKETDTDGKDKSVKDKPVKDKSEKVSDKGKTGKETVEEPVKEVGKETVKEIGKETVKKTDRPRKQDKSDDDVSDVPVKPEKHKKSRTDKDKHRESSTEKVTQSESSTVKVTHRKSSTERVIRRKSSTHKDTLKKIRSSTDKGKGKVGKKEKEKHKQKDVISKEPGDENVPTKEETPKVDTKIKKSKKHKLHEKPKEPVKVEEPVKDCPCKICEFMKYVPSDNLLIKKLKDEEKRRQLRDYYKEMCQRNRAKNEQIKCPAPPRRVEAIEFDNDFCCNPKLSEYCNCLKGMHELKKQLKCEYSNKDEVMSDMQNLIERMSKRFLECLN